MNGNDTFLDVNDAHLRVTSGNVYASAFNLDQIDIVMSSNTASTVNFNNPTKAFNAASNIEVGTANLFVDTTTTRVGVGTASPATTLDVAGDLNVSGNLTIIGTTTTLDTEHLTVKDPIIELGKDNTASPVVDLGLVMTRPSGSSNVGIIFDESADTLEIGYTQGSASDSTITMDSAPLSVNVNGPLSAAKDQDVTSYLGRAAIGYNGTNSNEASFAHVDHNTAESYTLKQTNSGATRINAKTGQNIKFNINDVERGKFRNNGDFAVDTDTLYVDATNDRVGVNTSSPGSALDVHGDGAFLHGGSGTPHNSNDLTLRLGGVNPSGSIIQSKCAIIVTPNTTYGGEADYGRNAMHFCTRNTQDNTNANISNAKISILPNGNVGFANPNPDKRIHARTYSNAILAGLDHVTTSGSSGNDEYVGLGFGATSSSQSNRIFKGGIFFNRKGGDTGRGDLLFCIENTQDNTTEVSPANAIMRITRNSDVGITGGFSVSGNATFDTDTLFVDSTNNRVGIGTTSPSQKFVVMGDSAIIHSNSADTHNTNDRTLYIGGREVNGSLNQSKCAIVSSPSTSYGGAGQYGRNALHFCVGPDAQNDTNASKTDSRMCIDYTGNVGIGTTSPAKKLHVEHYGSAIGDFEGIRIANHASLLHATSRPAYEFVVSDIAAGTGIGASKFAIGYRGTTSASRTDRLVIDNSGNVGIGIDSPSRTLDVSTTGSIGFGNNIGASAERGLYWSNGSDYAIYRTNGSWSSPNYQQLFLKWSTGIVLQTARGTYGRSHVGVDDRMSIGASYYATKSPTNGLIVEGNVGIGTSNPTSAKLHVLGSATILLNARYYNSSGDSANTNTNRPLSGYFGSHLACAELQVFSDRRIKTEIEDIDDGSALELFRQIQPKTYEYLDKVEKGNKRVYGFIAQEIKELIPEAVDVSTGKIPNIYEVANVSNSNVITFTHFNTSNLESNSNIIEVQTIHNKSESLNIIEVIDEHTIRVEENLSEWIGSVDESGNVTTGNELFVYGQEVNDFHHLKKSAIFTVTTAALQEVDRQLQDTKAQLATVLARLDALESA